MNQFRPIHLRPAEQALFDAICWDNRDPAFLQLQSWHEQRERIGRLADLLVRRRAIPPIRMRYFTDPDMLIGGRGKSLKRLFERNGLTRRLIYRHPHFTPILRYFICGPDLPAATIAGFQQALRDGAGQDAALRRRLRFFIRGQIRFSGLSRLRAASELFKLTHELGYPHLARWVRSEALAVPLTPRSGRKLGRRSARIAI